MTDRPTWTTETRKLGDLREWERNPRELSKHDAEHLARSIEKFNLADPLVINRDGRIIGGHQRKRVMLANGYAADDLVDVRVPSRQLTEREAEELNLRLNRNIGSFDWDILANEFEIADLLDWGFTDFDLEMHDIGEEEEPPEDPGAQLDRAAELQEKWGVERGQIWEVGTHRVMCGDSTCAEDVARLMAGEKAGAVVTDPPYGCTDLEWDRYPTQDDLDSWLSVSDGAVIAFGAAPPHCLSALLSLRPQVERVYVWWNTFTLTHSEGAFWQWQPIYVWRRSAFRGLERDVIQMAANTGGDEHLHVTQKPTELIGNLIKATDGTVYDPFLGSGTTIVACEQTGRRGFGMEICEKYVSVTLERLADMALEPRLAK